MLLDPLIRRPSIPADWIGKCRRPSAGWGCSRIARSLHRYNYARAGSARLATLVQVAQGASVIKKRATACLTPAWKPYDAAVSPERSKTELRADREEALVSGKDQDCPWLWLLAPGRGLFPSGSEHLTTRADARPRCFVARRRRRLITPVRSQRRHPGSTLVNLSPLPFATTSSN